MREIAQRQRWTVLGQRSALQLSEFIEPGELAPNRAENRTMDDFETSGGVRRIGFRAKPKAASPQPPPEFGKCATGALTRAHASEVLQTVEHNLAA
jgi:hypothetical protein